MKKVIFSVFLAFLISFSFFIFIQYSFQDELTIREKEFFSRSFDTTKSKILLLGSSHVGYLNTEIIKNIINKQYPNIEIFNLADTGDTPSSRLDQLPEVIKLKPKIIVYGISYRDFSDIQVYDNKIFPDPEQMTNKLINSNIEFLKNPKKTTLNIIRNSLGIEVNKYDKQPSDTPFFPYSNITDMVRTQQEIIETYNPEKNKLHIPNLERNLQLKSFDQILDNIEEKNIKIIIYITPLNSVYINNISEQDKQIFLDILEHIRSNHSVTIYSLLTNYTNQNVWATPDHVTHGSNGLIYNQDVADMILKELMK